MISKNEILRFARNKGLYGFVAEKGLDIPEKRIRCFSRYITVFLEKDRNVSGERPAYFFSRYPFEKKDTCFFQKGHVLFEKSMPPFFKLFFRVLLKRCGKGKSREFRILFEIRFPLF